MVKKLYTLFVALVLVPAFAFSNEEHHEGHEKGHTEEKFKAGEMIIEHVSDAHSIHFFNTETFHATLPLPCIVFGPNGLDMFMSSNLFDEHGHPKAYVAGSGTVYQVSHEGGSETIMYLDGDKWVPSLDFSITKNVVGLFIGLLLLVLIFRKIGKSYQKNGVAAPSNIFQSLLEPVIIFIRDEVAKPAIGHRYMYFMPYLLTVFFFIFFCNLLGLIPFIGGFNITGNIAVTLVLALMTFIIMVSKANGAFWMHILAPPGVPKALWLLLIPIEIIGLIAKPVVLTLRLFANITAGHIIILAFVSLIFIFQQQYGAAGAAGVSVVSVAFSIFMNLLELLVAFLQAYVFCLLSALYFGSAIEEAHH
ncbi:MAG TPA: F0F1 ATP synthase subunit A [Flavobacteriales bacterium]|nr:F0F1 ATP synthase subunit A [Flavobacteriales bacterium]